jgi:hypothetical protein
MQSETYTLRMPPNESVLTFISATTVAEYKEKGSK